MSAVLNKAGSGFTNFHCKEDRTLAGLIVMTLAVAMDLRRNSNPIGKMNGVRYYVKSALRTRLFWI
jgi:hypothetical protein